MPSATPCLWFNLNAEEAATYYTSLFPNSGIDRIDRTPADVPNSKAGDVITVEFTLDGQRFIGLNGGPDFQFNEAVSFVIECRDQAEVDRYWNALIADGGEPGPCGWLKDRFGLSWQVVPRQLNEMIRSDDKQAARRAMEAMLKMGKLDVPALRAAYEDRTPVAR